MADKKKKPLRVKAVNRKTGKVDAKKTFDLNVNNRLVGKMMGGPEAAKRHRKKGNTGIVAAINVQEALKKKKKKKK